MQDSDENEYFKPIYVIAAACKNMGIGNDSGLPWNLPNEFRYFMDRVTSVTAPGKKNLIVCGKNSFNIPEKYLPLENCLVAMLSTTLSAAPKYVQYLCRDFPTAIKIGSTPSLGDTVEKIWIIGGPKVFKEGLNHPWCRHFFLTDIMSNFKCDTFFPDFDRQTFHLLDKFPGVPSGIQEEKGIKYHFQVFTRDSKFSKPNYTI
ncbi:dihydrofolate reductase-like isoform X2 [Protopterus annectens]|uniref:dihydrofolate reductase-like isoform X2 n=1 Tax=Protopterus annectens TaxID=7888 RepID=UPI001CFAB86D|nr:dihydrofolate reductase-like isoform X2 [Protopterus annectens]